MQNRQEEINKAIKNLQSGTATPPDGQDPESMANTLQKASDRGGLGAYAAYKTAQRINATTA